MVTAIYTNRSFDIFPNFAEFSALLKTDWYQFQNLWEKNQDEITCNQAWS